MRYRWHARRSVSVLRDAGPMRRVLQFSLRKVAAEGRTGGLQLEILGGSQAVTDHCVRMSVRARMGLQRR